MATVTSSSTASVLSTGRKNRSSATYSDGPSSLRNRKRKPLSEKGSNVSLETIGKSSVKRAKNLTFNTAPEKKSKSKSLGLHKLRVWRCNAVQPSKLPVPKIPGGKKTSSKTSKEALLTWDWSYLRHVIDEIQIPDGVVDIDKDQSDLFCSSQYAADFIKHLKNLEVVYEIGRRIYDGDKPKVNFNARAVLVDWLIQVQTHLMLSQDTLHLCVAITDQLACQKEVGINKLQLVGVAALLIAAKFVERFPPEVKVLIHLTDNTFEYLEVIEMELEILQELKFYISYPTPVSFIDRYLQVSKATCAADACDELVIKMRHLACYFLDICLPDHRLVGQLPSKLAAAGLCLVHMILQDEDLLPASHTAWNKDLEFYTEFKLQELLPICQRISKLLCRMKWTKYKGAHNKFSQRKYDRISEWPVLCESAIIKELAKEVVSVSKGSSQNNTVN